MQRTYQNVAAHNGIGCQETSAGCQRSWHLQSSQTQFPFGCATLEMLVWKCGASEGSQVVKPSTKWFIVCLLVLTLLQELVESKPVSFAGFGCSIEITQTW